MSTPSHGDELMSELHTNPFEPSSPEIGGLGDAGISTLGKPNTCPRPWGPWATLGWTLLCVLVLIAIQFAVLLVFVTIRLARGAEPKFDDLATSGNVVTIGTLASTTAVVGLVALLVHLRRYPIRDYLALCWPPARSALIAFASLAVVLFCSDLLSYTLGRPLVPDVMVDLYRKAWLPGLLLALVVLAPVGEETLFRGFLYKGIADSRAGPIAAIITSAIAWAPLHFQYDWYGVVTIAVMGLLLGVIRHATGSLYLTMLLHALANAVATLEIVVKEHWLR
jgi:membrane protease YdiL (CAAX protease family)